MYPYDSLSSRFYDGMLPPPIESRIACLSGSAVVEWVCNNCSSWLLCSWTHLWSTSILASSDAEPNRYNCNGSRSVCKQTEILFQWSSTHEPSAANHKIFGSWRHCLLDSCFSLKGFCEGPLLLYLIPVLIMSLHAQTNFSFWMCVVKKKLYQSIGWNGPLHIQTHTNHIFPPPHIHLAPANVRCTLNNAHTTFSYLFHHYM